MLVWFILVGSAKVVFILWFRNIGHTQWDYGEAFAREAYMRAYLPTPCTFNGSFPCTQEQLASYTHVTTVDFWLDVRDNLRSSARKRACPTEYA